MLFRAKYRRLRDLAMLSILCGLIQGGCVIEFGPDGDTPPSGDPNRITIRLVNSTGTTLDPELYIAAEAVGADQLFQDSHKYTAFGVGTLGLLGPHGSADVPIDCPAARVLGTRGGKFGDNLNQPDGRGQPIILAQDASYICGDLITITYRRSGGSYLTSFSVSR